jgi:hypothetical protein
VTAAGIYAYVGKGAARFFRFLGPFVNIVYGYIPYGVAFTLGGLAILFGAGPWTGPLWIGTFALATLGIVLWFWHPYRIRPKWLRNSFGD